MGNTSQVRSLRGSISRNKVAVSEPAAGSKWSIPYLFTSGKSRPLTVQGQSTVAPKEFTGIDLCLVGHGG